MASVFFKPKPVTSIALDRFALPGGVWLRPATMFILGHWLFG